MKKETSIKNPEPEKKKTTALKQLNEKTAKATNDVSKEYRSTEGKIRKAK